MYGRGSKGSSDVIKRGSAFRPSGPEKYELFPSNHIVAPPLPLSERDEALVNTQRVLVNHMLLTASNTRVHLGSSEFHSAALSGEPRPELWKRLATEVGACYYPQELMTDSRSVLFGVPKKSSSNSAKVAKSLAALESSEQKGAPEGEATGEQSPKSNEEEVESSDESIGGDDYNVRMDFEDEGARDDYDDGGDDGGGDYGGEF
jgi:hypothetical protein